MRTTLTLDEDVYNKLREQAEQSGRPFREVVNDSLRRALAIRAGGPPARFRVRPRAMGKPPSENGYDDIPKLLDVIEGANRR
jgi:hypothetical protein